MKVDSYTQNRRKSQVTVDSQSGIGERKTIKRTLRIQAWELEST